MPFIEGAAGNVDFRQCFSNGENGLFDHADDLDLFRLI